MAGTHANPAACKAIPDDAIAAPDYRNEAVVVTALPRAVPQALVKSGVLTATTGPRGGFRLARQASEITLLHIVEAVDGASSPYECREIRQQGRGALSPEECASVCVLAQKMHEAHQAWRSSLSGVSLADVIDTLPATAPSRTRPLLGGS